MKNNTTKTVLFILACIFCVTFALIVGFTGRDATDLFSVVRYVRFAVCGNAVLLAVVALLCIFPSFPKKERKEPFRPNVSSLITAKEKKESENPESEHTVAKAIAKSKALKSSLIQAERTVSEEERTEESDPVSSEEPTGVPSAAVSQFFISPLGTAVPGLILNILTFIAIVARSIFDDLLKNLAVVLGAEEIYLYLAIALLICIPGLILGIISFSQSLLVVRFYSSSDVRGTGVSIAAGILSVVNSVLLVVFVGLYYNALTGLINFV